MSIRILIADDHEIVLEGLAAVIDNEPDLELVGRARDGREAVASALELAPDVIVMEIAMPALNGIEATRRIVVERPRIKVVCLSMHRERQYVEAALEAGAVGYLLKDRVSESCSPGQSRQRRTRFSFGPIQDAEQVSNLAARARQD